MQFLRESVRESIRAVLWSRKRSNSSCGYPAEERPQEDRFEEERIHWF